MDTMHEGVSIFWEKEYLRRFSTLAHIPKVGSEAREPTLLEERKRKRKPEEWQKNKKKTAVNCGTECSYIVKGVEKKIEKRIMKPPCENTCRLKCSERLNVQDRQIIFSEFYASGDKWLQSLQIASLVSQEAKKRTRSRGETKQRNREFTRTYSLVVKNERIKVCSKMFLNTLGIDEKRVRTVLNNKTETGAPKPDGRGRHANHKTEEGKASYVIQHIKKFQVLESHYTRHDTNYEYLPSDLSIAEMYRMYNEWSAEMNFPAVTYIFYFTVFKDRFNLKFDQPKKDSCDVCDVFKNCNQFDITEEMKSGQEEHLEEKETVRAMKENLKHRAKTEKEVATAAFDMQKVLLTPFGKSGLFYYSRRLINNNFTVTELDNMTTFCYFWNESECQKGSCEVATSLMQYLIKRSKEGIKEFNLFCDRSRGQNNNRMLLIMLSHVLNQFDISKINLIYLVSGHSQSENDHAHSLIEQTARNKTIFTPAEWEAVIQCSFPKNPCHLQVIEHQDIINFSSKEAFPEFTHVLNDTVQEMITEQEEEEQHKLNVILDKERRKMEKIYWSEVRMIRFQKESPALMFFKYSFNEEFRAAVFMTPKINLPQSHSIKNKQKYSAPCGVAQQKKDDLLNLCKTMLIPQRHHAFYENLHVTMSNNSTLRLEKKSKKV